MTNSRHYGKFLVAVPALLLVLLCLNPINIGYVRLGILVLLAAVFVGVTAVLWGRGVLRWAPLLLAGLAVAGLFIPGRDHDPEALRDCYVSSLRFYEGALYVWGGENRVGIDCSGLVRRGLLVANVKQGLLTLNPRLLRTAAQLWWQDASARELRNGYRGRTRRVIDTASINEADHGLLLPGDFAVTQNGVHALVYLGEGTWMEADPGRFEVIRVRVPVQGNNWFDTPVRMMRWRQLETK